MDIITYYISNSNKKYDFLGLKESNLSTTELQNVIIYTPNFCRENQSISTNELKSYIVSGISFFTRNALNQITGLINFDINQNVINILGICVPGISNKIGTFLINLVKKFAKANNIIRIKLTCYGNLKNFYLKQNFNIVNESTFYDSEEEEDEDEINKKIRYDMAFEMNNYLGGKKKKKVFSKKKKPLLTKRNKTLFLKRKK